MSIQTNSSDLIEKVEDEVLHWLPTLVVYGVLGATIMGAILGLMVWPQLGTDLMASIFALEPKMFWYLSRSSAFVSYGLIWMAMILGLVLSGRLTRIWPGGPAFTALHEHTSLLGLGFGLFHAVVLVGDKYIGYSLAEIFIPLANQSYKPVWVAIGQIALCLLVPVTLSYYVRHLIGQRTWRLIHYANFLIFAMVLAHGLWAGSDTTSPFVLMFYWASFISVFGLMTIRILRTASQAPRPTAVKPLPK